MKVRIWNEFFEERVYPTVSRHYPDGIHVALADALASLDAEISCATQDEAEHGLPHEILDETDVLLWWAHLTHEQVSDDVVERIHQRVLDGMGLVILHSGIGSKVAQRVLGTSCSGTGWRHGDAELLWTVDPQHPIARGVPVPVVIPEGEMYGEPLDIPVPDELVFLSSYSGGEVLRSGALWHRGLGRVAFFAPGHEESPIYYQPEIRHILRNVTLWAGKREIPGSPQNVPSREGEWPERWWTTNGDTR